MNPGILSCPVCLTLFQPTRPWQRFCCPACRLKALKGEHEPTEVTETPCYYCGELATTVDHVPPLSARPNILAFGLAGRYPFTEVPACRDCNCCGLNDRALWTLASRRRFVKQWLRRRYRKYLRIPEWDESEIGRLGPAMQRYVLHGLAMKEQIERRLAWGIPPN